MSFCDGRWFSRWYDVLACATCAYRRRAGMTGNAQGQLG